MTTRDVSSPPARRLHYRASVALRFTGAGAYSIDAKVFGRPRYPGLVAVGSFLVARATAVATRVILNDTNPIHLSDPKA